MASSPKKKQTAKKTARVVSPLAQLRKICLSLPESHEVEAWETPTFRVKNKLFAMYSEGGHSPQNDRPGVWIKSKHTVQEYLVHSSPKQYFKPPYVGPSGWTGAFLDGKPDWNAIKELLIDAYRQTAPKKLLAKLTD